MPTPPLSMATLYKKPNSKNWYAQFFDSTGKRISRSTGTTKKREAAKIAAGLEAKDRELNQDQPGLNAHYAKIIEAAAREAAAGELTLTRAEDLIQRLHRLANPAFKVISLEDHFDAWLEQQKAHVVPHTLTVYRDAKRRVLLGVGPKASKEPVGNLTQAQVEAAMAMIIKIKVKGTTRTISAASANMDLGILRRVLRSAVDQELARNNAAEGVRPLPTTDSIERAPFSTAEVRTMIDHKDTPDEWKGAILLAAHTGLRLGDVTSLGREHVEGSRLVIRPAKTAKSLRTLSVPLTPPSFQWIGERKGSFFPTLKGRKTGTLSTQFVRIMERAGVSREIIEAGNVVKRRSFHSLRHSFASWLAEADVHADVRQKLTGHQSAGVHGRYSHHDEALDRAVAQLPSL
ncbi:tyrosine-type recombinase/integrase [Akkermansiaceae bacterium]|nr:tyrosine-type recombinase/integrase [Akkermansiaceae bacterium]